MHAVFKILLTYFLLFFAFSGNAQESNLRLAMYEGILIAGYVDNGAFLNFGGPNLNATIRNTKILVGMFPSLRFKEDLGKPKNAFVFPILGFGLTYMYKGLAIQIPLYYNSKTARENGRWNIGIGIGLKIAGLNKKG